MHLTIFAHALVNVFATGRSDVKTYLFILYVLLLIGVYWLYRSKIIPHNHHGKMWVRAQTSMLIALFVSYTLNIIGYIVLVCTQNLSIFKYFIIHDAGLFTSMQLIHNHISKGAIAVLTHDILSVSTGHTDAGTPLLHLFSPFFFYAIFLLNTVVFSTMLIVWIVRLPVYTRLSMWRRCAAYVLFVITSFMVLKSLFDGGPLCFEAVLGVSFFLLVSTDHHRSIPIFSAALCGTYLIFLNVLYSLGYFSSPEYFGTIIFSFVLLLFVLIALYALYRYGITRLTVLLVILGICSYTVQLYKYVSIFEYVNIEISSRDTVSVISYNDLSQLFNKEPNRIGSLYLYTDKPVHDTTIGYIVSKSGFADNMQPVSVHWNTCIPSDGLAKYSFTIDTSRTLSATSSQIAGITYSSIPLPSNDGFRSYIEMHAPACFAKQLVNISQEYAALYNPVFIMSNIFSGYDN